MQKVIDDLQNKENNERFMRNVVKDKEKESKVYEQGKYKMDRLIESSFIKLKSSNV